MKLFRNEGKGPLLIGLFIIVFLIAVASQCRADELDLSVPSAVDSSSIEQNEGFSARRGVRIDIETGFTVFRARTPTLGVTVNFLDVGTIASRDFDLQLGFGVIGDYVYNGIQERNQLYVQGLIVDGFKKLDLGLGIVYLQNTDQLNGSNANFSLLAGYRFGPSDHYKIIWRHFSNAGTKLPNTGRDFVNFVLSF